MNKTNTNSDKPIALITGASRGIGAACALKLAASGYHCILAARTVGGLEEVDDQIRAIGGSATIVALDLRDGSMIDALGVQIYERYGKLDLLLGNAAMLGTLTPLAHQDPNEFDTVFQINVMANQRLIRVMDPLLQRAEKANVIMVTSSAGVQAYPYWGAYGASKAALNLMTQIYAEEVAHTNVKVNLLDPGGTATNMRAKAFPGEDPDSLKSPEAVANTMLKLLEGNTPHQQILRASA